MRPLFVIQRRAERASLKIKSYALTHSRQRGENGGYQDMEQILQLVVIFFAALATGGLMVN